MSSQRVCDIPFPHAMSCIVGVEHTAVGKLYILTLLTSQKKRLIYCLIINLI